MKQTKKDRKAARSLAKKRAAQRMPEILGYRVITTAANESVVFGPWIEGAPQVRRPA